jgi:hypothetical protein
VRSRRLVALALLIAFLPACATSRQATIAEGTILTAASVAALASGAVAVAGGRDCEMDPEEDCDLAGPMYMVGGVLLAAGAVMGRAAAWKWTKVDDEDDDAPMRTALPPPPPPLLGADGLPVRPTDAETLQLARQAARAASLRQCSAARITLREIAARDAAYHADLTATATIGACL